jgi:hypothetical protein
MVSPPRYGHLANPVGLVFHPDHLTWVQLLYTHWKHYFKRYILANRR